MYSFLKFSIAFIGFTLVGPGTGFVPASAQTAGFEVRKGTE